MEKVGVIGFEQGFPHAICTDSCCGAPVASMPASTVIHSPLNRLGTAVAGLIFTAQDIGGSLSTTTGVRRVMISGAVPPTFKGGAIRPACPIPLCNNSVALRTPQCISVRFRVV